MLWLLRDLAMNDEELQPCLQRDKAGVVHATPPLVHFLNDVCATASTLRVSVPHFHRNGVSLSSKFSLCLSYPVLDWALKNHRRMRRFASFKKRNWLRTRWKCTGLCERPNQNGSSVPWHDTENDELFG